MSSSSPHVRSTPARRGPFALLAAVLTVFAVALAPLTLVVSSAEAARNKAPTIRAIGTQTVLAGRTLVVRPKASDRDHRPRKLRFSTMGRPGWLHLNKTTGVLKGRAPMTARAQQWRVTLRASDGRAMRSRTFTVKKPANKAPRLAEISNRNVVVGDKLIVRPHAVDPDRGPKSLTYSQTGKPSWATFDWRTGYLTGRPTAPMSARKVTITAKDGLATAKRSFTVRAIAKPAPNEAPKIEDQDFSIAENGSDVGRIGATDADGDAIKYTIIDGNHDGAFELDATTGALTASGLDFEHKETYTLTVQASDNRLHDEAVVTVTVTDENDAPAISPIDDVPAVEDETVDPIEIEATDQDANDSLTLDVSGLPAGLGFDQQSRTITGTPTVPGDYTVTVTATDTKGLSATATFELTVENVNDAPMIDDRPFTVEQNSPKGDEVGTLVATDDDLNQLGDTLTFSSESTDFEVAEDGTVTVGDADLSRSGAVFDLEVRVEDRAGATDTAVVTITVSNTEDDAPVFTPVQPLDVEENSAPGTRVGQVEAIDPDGDAVSYAITGGNALAEDGAFAIDAVTGELTVAGPLDAETKDSYELTVTATAGTESATATVTVHVTDVNEAPVITPIDDQDATEDEAVAPITVEAVDHDADDKATVTVTGLPGGLAYGNGTITGTPTVPGEYTVTVTATDANGLASTAEFTLTVANTNDAPVIVPVDDVAAAEDAAIEPVTLAATDEDGDDVTFELSALPAGLTWDAATATISGTPTEAGTFEVTVTARDGHGGTATDTFMVSVENVDDAPVVESIDPTSLTGTVDEELEQAVTVVTTDEDGDELELSAEDLPAGLEATDNGDSTLTVAGTPTEAGDVTATIVATDPDGLTGAADLAVSITDSEPACTPISTLPCADVPVELPHSLAFDGDEGGLDDTGFTMVDAPSARAGTNQAPAPTTPTHADVPGYEPGLLAVEDGALSVTATKGIMYAVNGSGTGQTSETNSQLNTLGVGVTGSEAGYELESTLVAPAFPGGTNSSQQGGLWFGLGEDDFVKAAVARTSGTQNKVQLVTETGGVAAPSNQHELNSAAFANGQDVRLVLRVTDTPGDGGEVSLEYAVDGGELKQLTDTANTVSSTALPIPQGFFDGKALADDAGTSSFAGVYSTKRRAAAGDDVVVNFADFAVEEIPAPDTSAPAAPAGLAATVADGSVELTWDANTEEDLAGYRVFRSTSAEVDTDGTPISGDAPITDPSFTDDTVAGGTTYHYAVVAVDESGNVSAASDEVSATTAETPELHEKFVFQPASGPGVAGYAKHTGTAWTDTAGHGFVRQDSLDDSVHQPLDMTTNTRFRTRPAPVTALQNSLVHLQYGDSTPPLNASHNAVPGAFELAVPDGWYEVSLGVGDQGGGNGYDSKHTVNVEGRAAITGFQGSAAQEYRTATVTTQVTDGRLTVDAVGGTNTKINHLEVDSTTEPTEPVVHQKIRFSDQASTPPAGYLKDFGQAYGARGDADQGEGQTYGWRAQANGQPVSLVGNGRNRSTGANPPAGLSALQAGLMHMQLPANAEGGVKTPGYWEMQVPDGAYTVSVSAGDATSVDSEHWLNIEGQNAVAEFVPTGGNGAATHWTTATRTVVVTDGELTVTPESGTNTKINWVTLDSVAGASQRPSVLEPAPANLATSVSPTGSVVADLSLVGSGVEPSTLGADTVTLTEVSSGEPVDANVITSGGADVINLSPRDPLAPNTLYRFSVTEGVTDVDGRAFLPYSSVFTTGTTTGGGGPVAFDKADSGAPAASSADMGYSSIVKGPDGRMYAGTLGGTIYRFDIAADGKLTNRFAITSVKDYSNSAASGDTYRTGIRSVIGMAFDPASTPANPILWISDNAPYTGQSDVPDSSGRIGKLTGANLQTYTAVVDGLPRSVKDHEANSVAFGPDGALYLNVGANNAMGAPDGAWANRAERLLSAAVLRLDPAKLPAQLPVNVRTGDAGSYDPFAANAPLTLHATGVRNAYDLVWHSNGHLYVPTNGSASGGNVPGVPDQLPASCANRADGGYTGPKVGAQTNNPQETDYVFDVRKGKYYGHPNPSRCEYVLNNGNPTDAKDAFENSKYPVGTQADPNYDLAGVYDAGLHASANGVIEYRSNAFGGALKGKLIYVRYSDGQDLVTFDVASNGKLSNRTTGISGFTGFNQPLDVTEDTATGNLYVTQLGNGTIALVKPQGGGDGPAGQATERLVFSGPTGSTSPTRDALVVNTGVSDLTITGATLRGADAGQFVQGPGVSYPLTVPAGEIAELPVAFKPTSVGVKTTELAVQTDAGTKTVQLRGLAMAGYEGGNEPSLQRIMDAYDIPIDVGDPDPSNASMPSTQGMIGDEVPAQLFQKAAFDAPISITPLAAFGPRSHQVHVGWHDAGEADGVHRQYTIASQDLQGLMIDPDGGTTNIDPGEETAFGIYSEWPAFADRRAYTEDALNTWDSTLPHHVRVYPFENPDGSVEPNTYVLATEEIPGSFDSQDVVLKVTNVKPYVPEAGDAELKVTNPDPTPFADQIAFSRIQQPANAQQRVADTGTARISNTGTEPMQVTGLDLNGAFALVNPPALPFTLAPGASKDVTIRFTATATKVHQGTLQVRSNASNGAQTIRLGGLWQSLSENGQEPSVVQIARAFGIGSDIPTDLNSQGHVEAVGDEVLSPYWFRRDTAKPVTVRQLSAYHTYPGGASVKWFPKGGSATNLTGHNNLYAQSLLPLKNETEPASATFAPSGGAFGFAVDGESSDPTKNNQSADEANGCVQPCGHHVRIFQVEDREGDAVPGSYLLMMDYSGINYDYNDNTYLLTNIKPEKLRMPQGLGASAGDGEVTLSWSPTGEDGVGYRVWRDTDADVPIDDAHRVSGPAPLTEPTFTDPDVTNGTTYYYVVRAVIAGEANSDSTPAIAVTPNDAGAFVEKVNFQNPGAAVPAGYLRDFGEAFGLRDGANQGTGLSYGWLHEDGTGPLNLSVGGSTGPGNGRDRNLETDQRLDTFLHMQAEDVPNFNGTPVNGLWEMAVPDGSYAVTVAVGDGANNSDPEIHTVTVEGTPAIEGFVPSGSPGSPGHHDTATVTVEVEDGRLTLDALGGTNTKIDYVDIAAAD